MTYMLSSGVYLFEYDLSQFPTMQAITIGAIVGQFAKGPIGPFYISDKTTRHDLYGLPDNNHGYAGYCADAFLDQSQNLLIRRVISDDALYAGLSYYNTEDSTKACPFYFGINTDYTTGYHDIQLLEFSREIFPGDSVIIQTWDYQADSYAQAGFGTEALVEMDPTGTNVTPPFIDSNSTLIDLATSLTSSPFIAGQGNAQVIKETTGAPGNQISSLVFSYATNTSPTQANGKPTPYFRDQHTFECDLVLYGVNQDLNSGGTSTTVITNDPFGNPISSDIVITEEASNPYLPVVYHIKVSCEALPSDPDGIRTSNQMMLEIANALNDVTGYIDIFSSPEDTTVPALGSNASMVPVISASAIPPRGKSLYSTIQIVSRSIGPDSFEIQNIVITDGSDASATPPVVGNPPVLVSCTYSLVIQGKGSNDDRVLRIFNPVNAQLQVAPSVLADVMVNSNTPLIVKHSSSPKLFDVFAENPGDWGDDLGIRIAAIDPGTPQRWKMNFTNGIMAGSTFSCSLYDTNTQNSIAIGPICWQQNSVDPSDPTTLTTYTDDQLKAMFLSTNRTTETKLVDPPASGNFKTIALAHDPLLGYGQMVIRRVFAQKEVYQGTANAAAATPNAATNYTGIFDNTNIGWFYKVTTASTDSSGNPVASIAFANASGALTLAVGDFVIWDGTYWQIYNSLRVVTSIPTAGQVRLTGNKLIFNVADTGPGWQYRITYYFNNLSLYVNFTNSDQMFKIIAYALQLGLNNFGANSGNLVTIDTSVVGTYARPTSGSNYRSIILTAPVPGNDFTVYNPTVTGGVVNPIINTSIISNSVAPDGTFTFEVYLRSNISFPVESWRASLDYLVDGLGNQLNIFEVVNRGPNKSKYIRIFQPASRTTTYSYSTISNQVLNPVSVTNTVLNVDVASDGTKIINWLNGGDQGSVPTSDKIIAAWDDFANPDIITARLLINCGYTAVEIQQHMLTLAQKRRDCFAILDMPNYYQDTTGALNYRNNVLNANTSYGGIFTPDLIIFDDYSKRPMFIPPSGHIAAQMAYTALNAHEWFSSAGLNRGLLQNVLGLRLYYTESDRDRLATNQINYVRRMPGLGFPLWEALTLQRMSSSLSHIPVRMLMITLEVTIADALKYIVHEPNDEITRTKVVGLCETILYPVQLGRGLYGYKVISDDSNNPSYLIQQGVITVTVEVSPVIPGRFIKLNMVLTPLGVSFDEIDQNQFL